jgi:hypothetical protein
MNFDGIGARLHAATAPSGESRTPWLDRAWMIGMGLVVYVCGGIPEKAQR